MLESAYVLVIDSKNLLDTLDEIRIDQSSDVNSNSEPEEEPTTSSVTTSCSTPMNSEQMMLPNKPHEFWREKPIGLAHDYIPIEGQVIYYCILSS